MISKNNSFKGYKFTEWLKKNKDTLKTLVVVVASLSTFVATTYMPVWANAGLTALIGIVSKLGVDALDFFLSEIKN